MHTTIALSLLALLPLGLANPVSNPSPQPTTLQTIHKRSDPSYVTTIPGTTWTHAVIKIGPSTTESSDATVTKPPFKISDFYDCIDKCHKASKTYGEQADCHDKCPGAPGNRKAELIASHVNLDHKMPDYASMMDKMSKEGASFAASALAPVTVTVKSV